MNDVTRRVRKSIDQDNAFAASIMNLKVVPNEEIAKKVATGIQKFKTMSEDEFKKLQKLSVKEIMKGWKDRDVAMMAKAIESTLGILSDTLAGNVIHNPMWGLARKGLEHLTDPNSTSLIIANRMAGPESTGIDLAWRRAFNFLSPTNAKEVEVINWRMGLRFFEYRFRSEKPKPTTIGSTERHRESARFFAAAFQHEDGELEHSLTSINEMLAYIRMEALTMQSLLAYRTIFAKNVDGTSVVDNSFDYSDTEIFKDWSTSSTDRKVIEEREVFQVRHVLNESRRRMIDHAGQVQNLGKRDNYREAPIRVTANDVLLFYYDHSHRELIDKVNQALVTGIRGEEGVSPTLLDRIAFIESSSAPFSGGLDITKQKQDHDDWGFLEDVEESFAKKKGGMLTIPGNLNYFLNFRPLTFLQHRDVMAETEIYGAKFEANALMDSRQKAHITFADN